MVKNPCPFYIHSTSLKEVVYAMIIRSSNTQCMKIDEEENTWLKEKSALLNFRNTEQ